MVRYIGSDIGASQVTNPAKMPGELVRVAPNDRGFEFAGQQLEAQGKAMLASLQGQASITQQSNESFQQTNAAMAQATQQTIGASLEKGRQTSQAFLQAAQVGQNIAETLDRREQTRLRAEQLRIQEEERAREKADREAELEAKRLAALREAQLDANKANVGIKLSQWELQAQEIARKDPAGLSKLQTGFHRIINEGGELRPDDVAGFYKQGYGGVLSSLESERVGYVMKEDREVRDTNREARVNTLMVTAASYINGVATARSTEERTTFTNRLYSEVVKPVLESGGDRLLIARVNKTIAEATQKAVFLSDKEQREAHQESVKIIGFLNNAQDIFDKTPDKIQAYSAIKRLALIEDIPLKLADEYDPLESQKRVNEYMEQQLRTEKLKDERELIKYGDVTFNNVQVGYLSASVYTEADLETFKIQNKHMPGVVAQVEAVFKLRRKHNDAVVNYNKEVVALQEQKQALSTDNIDSAISLLKSLKPGKTADSMRDLLGSIPGIDALQYQSVLSQIGKYQELDRATQAAWEKQLTGLYRIASKNRESMSVIIDNKAAALSQELNVLQQEMAAYGYTKTGKFNEALFKQMKASELKQRQQLEVQKQGGDSSQASPFKLPEVYSYTMKVGGQQRKVFTPLAKTVNRGGTHAWNNYNQHRQYYNNGKGGHHKGEDIAAPEGTPLVAMLGGKVTRVSYDKNGYGNWFEVQYDDGSYHLHAHLQKRPPLTVGQTVAPGQIMGLIGNTGKSSGAHLHWEVRVGAEEKVINPYDWASKYEQTWQKYRAPNPYRGKNQDLSRPQAQVPGSIPSSKVGEFIVIDPATKKLTYYRPETKQVREGNITAAKPARLTSNNSRNVKDYDLGDLEANHGYVALSKDDAFRRKLNSVARDLGFPGQWLADVMVGESGFGSDTWNKAGAPAAGLIQFHADPGTPGRKNINGKSYKIQDIARMNRLQQLDLVREYFKMQIKHAGKPTTPEDILGLVWAGRLDKDIPPNMDDISIAWKDYRTTLGRYVGRKYSDAPTRVNRTKQQSSPSSNRIERLVANDCLKPRAGDCLGCRDMERNGVFFPHKRVPAEQLTRRGVLPALRKPSNPDAKQPGVTIDSPSSRLKPSSLGANY